MKNSIIIREDSGINHHYICPSCPIDYYRDSGQIAAETIPHVNSYGEALKLGWRKTRDIHFCPPEEDHVMVCPSCAAKYEWSRISL